MKKILILGGGFGGVYCAKRLQKIRLNSFDIELISDNNYFVFQPLLPEVASGTISASDAVTPIRQMLNDVKFRNAEVNLIDIKKKKIGILQGFRKRQHFIQYDELIIALGQESNLDIVPGLANNAFTMRNLNDAYNLRNHVIRCLELADVTLDLSLKKRLLSFVVVGGGFSGVETIGELKEMIDRLIKYYRNINKNEIRFYLIEYASSLLPELEKEIGLYTLQTFKKQNIKVFLNTKLREVSSMRAYINNNKSIESNTIISTIGSTASKLLRNTELPLKFGKLITNEYCQVVDIENVWALGDCALVPNKVIKNDKEMNLVYSPPTAQFAVQQAKILSKNVVLKTLKRKLKSFKYTSRGSLASLGSKKGVGKIFFFRVKGLLAWIIWKGFYLSFIPSIPTRVRVFFNWLLEFFVPRNAVLTNPLNNKPFEKKNYKRGDIVFEEGMLPDGFYIVKSGEFSNSYRKTTSGKTFKKKYKKGDHFGSRVILEGGRRTGTIKALKNSEVLKINKESFKILADNLPVMKKYFSEYLPKNFSTLKLKE